MNESLFPLYWDLLGLSISKLFVAKDIRFEKNSYPFII